MSLNEHELQTRASKGKGPVILLEKVPPTFEKQDIRTNMITADIRPFITQFNYLKDNNAKEAYYMKLALTSYILHEYAHYGDKWSNNGVNTGQTDKKEGDLDFSTCTPDIQMRKAASGHRGTDMDHYFIHSYFYTEGSNFYKTEGFRFNADQSTVYPQFKNNIIRYSRFGPYGK